MEKSMGHATEQKNGGDGSALTEDQVRQGFTRAVRALRTLSAGGRTLLRASNENDLLQEMCRVIVETGGYRLSAVAYAEQDERRSLRWMAAVGVDIAFLETLRYTWTDTKSGRNATGTAIRTGRPDVARNLLTDPVYADPGYDSLRERGRRMGFASSTSFPLRIDGEVFGALTMAAPEPDAFDAEEIALLGELADDLAYGIANLRLSVQHRKAQAIIVRQAYYDPLTGLPNRTLLQEKIEARMTDARQQGRALALLHLEVGRLSEVNKVLGYRAGEELLQELARRLAKAVRPDEVLARVGDAEFAILLQDGSAHSATQAAQHLAVTLGEPVEVTGLMLQAGMSIGIALFPEHATNAQTLIQRANAAMHQARPIYGGYAMYRSGQEQEYTRRLALIGDLHRAIRGNEMRLYCQPKVDIASRRVCGVEALVRWQHPRHGMVSTAEFIRLAEQAGTITPLTHWMLDAAFRQSHAWSEAGVNQALAINLSAYDLYSPGLADRIGGLFSTWGISPQMIQFELTESALMADPAAAMETLTCLKNLGVELFIDDFGTGYSGLSYLQRLPVDGIKIDQSFVMPMISSGDSEVIVHSTIELGHNLGLKVTAEGVETDAVWKRLAALGCDVAQGYLISMPMPAQSFESWNRRWAAN
ncbi:GGDEF domain-containing protein [Noviherbaspirillum sp. 1P10PC]|uniref:putative bifunctional diguanylate cyclase/phosphodiesterase n=1 Tax=Noviherbaspirillum sp. 1P10PC TaxID=3132292 RepID=UPI0039A2EEB3